MCQPKNLQDENRRPNNQSADAPLGTGVLKEATRLLSIKRAGLPIDFPRATSDICALAKQE